MKSARNPPWLERLLALPDAERPRMGQPCPCHGKPMEFTPGESAGPCACGGELIYTTGGHGGLYCLTSHGKHAPMPIKNGWVPSPRGPWEYRGVRR